MIKEAYCSYEVAKLLKEKGFNEYCLKNYWSSDKELHDWKWELSYNRNSDENRNTKDCAAPTHQMAMAWLREKHNLYIGINIEVGDIQMLPSYDFEETVLGYTFVIYDKETLIWVFKDKTPRSYEDAVEAALKYCLENLI
jgi:hypothetical protein